MGQRGAGATRQRGAHPAPMGSQGWAAEGVHAAVNPVKPPGTHPAPHRPGAQAKLQQLTKRNNAVLTLSELDDLGLEAVRPHFRRSPRRNCGVTRHADDRGLKTHPPHRCP
jgi:hypothetical protein